MTTIEITAAEIIPAPATTGTATTGTATTEVMTDAEIMGETISEALRDTDNALGLLANALVEAYAGFDTTTPAGIHAAAGLMAAMGGVLDMRNQVRADYATGRPPFAPTSRHLDILTWRFQTFAEDAPTQRPGYLRAAELAQDFANVARDCGC